MSEAQIPADFLWVASTWSWIWPVLITGIYVSLAVVFHRWLTQQLELRRRVPLAWWQELAISASGWPLLMLFVICGVALLCSLWPIRFATREVVLRLTHAAFLLLLVSLAHQSLNSWFRRGRPGSWLRITLLRKIVLAALYLSAAMMLLRIFGYEITALLTTLGIGSLAIAFASQQVLTNFFSGIQLSIDRPLEIGQSVTLENGMEGEVLAIGWMKTWLRAPDGSRLLVPNSKLTGMIIRNYTLGNRGPAVQVKLPIDRAADLARAEELARSAAFEVTRELSKLHPKMEPLVQFTEFTPLAAVLTVTLFASDYKQAWHTRSEFVKVAGRALADAKIKMA